MTQAGTVGWTVFKEKISLFRTGWFWNWIFFPFLAVRAVLLFMAWLATYFTPNPSYPDYVQRGYYLSPFPYLDMWSKWDAQWYFSIVKHGYIVPDGFPNSSYSNLVFFPLYPYLVKLISLVLPPFLQRDAAFLTIGLVISNAAFLAAAAVLYKIITEYLFDEGTAQRTMILLLIYPASFFMSSFYTEGLFLCLVVCGFYAGLKKKWMLAGILAGLCTLTRIQGIVLLAPLGWMYMEARQWKPMRIRWDVLWFGAAPLCLAGYLYFLYLLTGRPMALVEAEAPWGRSAQFSFERLFGSLKPAYGHQIARVDAALFILFILVTVLVWIKIPNKSYALFCVGMLAIPFLADQFASMTRYLSCIFPVYIVLGYYCKNPKLYTLLKVFWFALLIFYWVGWQNNFWIS